MPVSNRNLRNQSMFNIFFAADFFSLAKCAQIWYTSLSAVLDRQGRDAAHPLNPVNPRSAGLTDCSFPPLPPPCKTRPQIIGKKYLPDVKYICSKSVANMQSQNELKTQFYQQWNNINATYSVGKCQQWRKTHRSWARDKFLTSRQI